MFSKENSENKTLGFNRFRMLPSTSNNVFYSALFFRYNLFHLSVLFVLLL